MKVLLFLDASDGREDAEGFKHENSDVSINTFNQLSYNLIQTKLKWVLFYKKVVWTFKLSVEEVERDQKISWIGPMTMSGVGGRDMRMKETKEHGKTVTCSSFVDMERSTFPQQRPYLVCTLCGMYSMCLALGFSSTSPS